jgi:hypothetical protein
MVKVKRAVTAPEFLDVGNNLIVVSLGAARNIHTESSNSIRDATPNVVVNGGPILPSVPPKGWARCGHCDFVVSSRN